MESKCFINDFVNELLISIKDWTEVLFKEFDSFGLRHLASSLC